MEKNEAMQISKAEWKEIMQVTQVREGWGLEEDENVEDFKSMVYGAKFDFTSGGPGYCGDLYIVQGDALEPPVVLIRKNGVLIHA